MQCHYKHLNLFASGSYYLRPKLSSLGRKNYFDRVDGGAAKNRAGVSARGDVLNPVGAFVGAEGRRRSGMNWPIWLRTVDQQIEWEKPRARSNIYGELQHRAGAAYNLDTSPR